jgi:molybdenum cofactor synthesis domain-containing protein
MEFDLLKKNELKFVGVDLDDANLNDLAAAIAEVLEMEVSEVFVTDYLDRTLTFDILRDRIYPHQIIDKQAPLMARLGAMPGVRVDADAKIRSEGMLGWIAADAEQANAALIVAERMSAEILDRWSRRTITFATGAEVKSGQVKDTNTATIAEQMVEAGFTSAFGGTLSDDIDLIAGSIRRAVGDGYGIVFTTGGVGAEAKDCTVEAVLMLDPGAATPVICTFEKGKGRHVKDAIRIAVGELDGARIIALPGPNDEVRACLPTVIAGLTQKAPKADLAEALAVILRDKWRQKANGFHHAHHHHH